MKITISFRNLIITLFFLSSCSIVNDSSSQKEKSTYFVSVPIAKFSPTQLPCINIKVENKTLLATLDLGFRGHVAIISDQTSDLTSKTFLGEKTMYGIRGKSYNEKIYDLPNIEINDVTFSSLFLQEDSVEFLNDATFLENETQTRSPHEPARLGWELFVNTCLFIDAHNSKIAFCDSFETFKKKERGIDTFVKAPLLLERGLVEFDCLTPKGPVRCMLDTGSTYNIFNEENEEISEQALWLPDNIVEYPFFQLEGSDFGPIAFHRMSLKTPIRIEAILGMEFIKNHRIFLDFANKSIYFSSNHWAKSKIRTSRINHSKPQQNKT